MTTDNITELVSKEDRHFLIKKGLQQPAVAHHIVNGPTAAARIDNAIYALERGLKETPSDELLLRAYSAIRVEYPEHFRSSYSKRVD